LYWLKKLATGIRERMPPKSGLAKACDYLLRYWDALTAHVDHGETRLDNNLVENAIRPSAIGKKTGFLSDTPTPANAPRSFTRSSSRVSVTAKIRSRICVTYSLVCLG
jgi:hypothetical protein